MNGRKFLISSMAGTVVERLALVSGPRLSSAAPGTGGLQFRDSRGSPSCPSIWIQPRLRSTTESTAGFWTTSTIRYRTGFSLNRFAAPDLRATTSKLIGNRFPGRGRVEIAEIEFQKGQKSVRLRLQELWPCGRYRLQRPAYARLHQLPRGSRPRRHQRPSFWPRRVSASSRRPQQSRYRAMLPTEAGVGSEAYCMTGSGAVRNGPLSGTQIEFC